MHSANYSASRNAAMSGGYDLRLFILVSAREKLIFHLPNPIRFLIFLSTFILFLIGENIFSAFLLLLLHWHKLPHTSFLLDIPMNDLLIHQKNYKLNFKHAGIKCMSFHFFVFNTPQLQTLIHLRRYEYQVPKKIRVLANEKYIFQFLQTVRYLKL